MITSMPASRGLAGRSARPRPRIRPDSFRRSTRRRQAGALKLYFAASATFEMDASVCNCAQDRPVGAVKRVAAESAGGIAAAGGSLKQRELSFCSLALRRNQIHTDAAHRRSQKLRLDAIFFASSCFPAFFLPCLKAVNRAGAAPDHAIHRRTAMNLLTLPRYPLTFGPTPIHAAPAPERSAGRQSRISMRSARTATAALRLAATRRASSST